MSSRQVPPTPPPSDPKEMAAAALNEHGFLFAQIIREDILANKLSGDPNIRHTWNVVVPEYPVTAGDGSQTKIDLVLQKSNDERFYISMECKRPHPKYKRWLFWDTKDTTVGQTTANTLYIESLQFVRQTGSKYEFLHGIERSHVAHGCPVFTYYVEAIQNRNRQEQYSSTETLEKAFLQLVRGNTGLVRKFQAFNKPRSYRSIPVLVTTAELFEVKFDDKKVSRTTGMVRSSDLDLHSLKYCAVFYRPDDSLSVPVDECSAGRDNVILDLFGFQGRTVFVVQSTAINEFLFWLSGYLK